MKKKLISTVIAIILILIIGAVAGGSYLIEKYSYSKERADLNEYFQVSDPGVRAVILQDEMIPEQAVIRDGICYFDLDTVHQYFNEIFYADIAENLLLYTTPTDTIRVKLGGTVQESSAGSTELGYVAAFTENDIVYVAADYVKLFTNCSVDVYERQVQVYTQWGEKTVDTVRKDTAVRLKGGIKSPILCDIQKGTEVEILEEMDTWSKVKTSDAIIGYVENKMLEGISNGQAAAVQETPVTDYEEPQYTSITMDGKVSLGWHAIGGAGGNDTLETMTSEAKGMNVIAPTWFSINDNEGNLRSFASADYVKRAHGMGLQVWGVVDDFNYNNETNAGIQLYEILSSTAKRQTLVANIIKAAQDCGMDGINVDFEKVTEDSGIHYVQFLRELSVECRKNSLVLSIDNYVPFHFNDHYRLDIQGQLADYVIIMGYDEHWHGSQEPGSVASIDYVKNGLEKTLQEVPASKVINALPFYTILWKIDGAAVTDEYLTINNTADFLKRMNIQPVWNEETCQNYAEWTSGTATYRIWLEDEQSISSKLSVMEAQKIAGVAVWRLGYGTSSVWELLQAYAMQ